MIFAAGPSGLSREELEKKAKEEGILLLNPKKINSEEELLLAAALAKSAIRQKRSIAKKEEVEFLLWLSAKTNIKSAQEEYLSGSAKQILLVSLKKGKTKQELLSEFKIREQNPKLKKKATAQEIERISLSRL
jgi:tRNA threonylcarbamoyladenosine modification (KEOPS) complex Cgi121 subunit